MTSPSPGHLGGGGGARASLVEMACVGRGGNCCPNLAAPPPAPANSAASPRGGWRRARRGMTAAPAPVGRLRGAAALAGAGGELLLPRLRDGSCFSRRGGSALGEGGRLPLLPALGEGGRLPLLLWGGSEEQLPLPEPEESCSSPGSAMAAASPARGAARSAREDGCPCSCMAARRSSCPRWGRRRAAPPPGSREGGCSSR